MPPFPFAFRLGLICGFSYLYGPWEFITGQASSFETSKEIIKRHMPFVQAYRRDDVVGSFAGEVNERVRCLSKA
jgi:hypothetical protein